MRGLGTIVDDMARPLVVQDPAALAARDLELARAIRRVGIGAALGIAGVAVGVFAALMLTKR